LDQNKEKISIVVPLLDEQDSLVELFDSIKNALNEEYAFEVIFVDDGSRDRSWEIITELADKHEQVKGVRFRRNYGKSYALQKGFEQVTGQYVVTIDADLQDDPAEIPDMIQMLKNGHDLVSGWKQDRKDPISKTIPSRFFNKVTSMVTGIKLHDFNCGLKAYKRKVVDRLDLYGEMHRYIPLLAYWDGYREIGEKKVKHHPRKHGVSKFGLSRFINGFLDLLTLMFINFYLQRPMHFFGTLGSAFLISGSGITGYLVIMRIFFNEFLAGRPLLLFGILLILLGIQFFTIGLFGEMIYKNRTENRNINIREKLRGIE
jgi:glycosyltransferase involved in cell wall biosynthesis